MLCCILGCCNWLQHIPDTQTVYWWLLSTAVDASLPQLRRPHGCYAGATACFGQRTHMLSPMCLDTAGLLITMHAAAVFAVANEATQLSCISWSTVGMVVRECVCFCSAPRHGGGAARPVSSAFRTRTWKMSMSCRAGSSAESIASWQLRANS